MSLICTKMTLQAFFGPATKGSQEWLIAVYFEMLLSACSVAIVLVTQSICLRLHSFAQHFVYTAFDIHRFTTLPRKHKGTTRESPDATNTIAGGIAGCPRGTITSQVCLVSFLALHTAAEPAVRAAVKNQLSYGNDTIIAFFFEANKNKDNAIIALASTNN